jgi:hypothetical protein
MTGTFDYPDMLNESWSMGFRLISDATGTARPGYVSNPDGFLGTISSAIATWYTGATVQHLLHAKLVSLKCNNIDSLGHYAENVTHEFRYSTPPVGSINSSVPAFCTTAITWETGHSTGLARKGRVYPPIWVQNDTGKGVTLSTARMLEIRDAYKALTDIINRAEVAPGSGNIQLAVVSAGSKKHNTSGTYVLVNGVSVNSVIDVQRRRKKSALASRTAFATVAP